LYYVDHVGVFGSIPAILFFGGGTDANMNRNIIINSNKSAIGLTDSAPANIIINNAYIENIPLL
ncbi:hypothetical protein ACNR90_000044, partial (mitochondrion) [Candidozyma auris]